MSATRLERLRSADYMAAGGKLVRVRLRGERGQKEYVFDESSFRWKTG